MNFAAKHLVIFKLIGYSMFVKGVSKMSHHVRTLFFRILLLVAAVFLYIAETELFLWIEWVTWVVLAAGMLRRIFPDKRVAAGARKHVKRFYIEAGRPSSAVSKHLHKGAFLSGLMWLAITVAILFGLFAFNLLTPQTVLLLALLYAVADLVFILIFCPLQAFFMKNACCTTCRIYNWDYFMICAPLIVFPSFYSISLVVLAAVVVVQWEVAVRKNPQFFVRESNAELTCAACRDKTCGLRKIFM